MSQLFGPPVMQALDASGNPYSGALLYFYQSSSSSLLTVYQDSNLATPHSNPVVADSSGLFPAIYVNVNPYKVILKTSAGVTVWTIDPAGTFSVGGIFSTLDVSGTNVFTGFLTGCTLS